MMVVVVVVLVAEKDKACCCQRQLKVSVAKQQEMTGLRYSTACFVHDQKIERPRVSFSSTCFYSLTRKTLKLAQCKINRIWFGVLSRS
jgi:hypothetical protein